jgi:hypothetical protein
MMVAVVAAVVVAMTMEAHLDLDQEEVLAYQVLITTS